MPVVCSRPVVFAVVKTQQVESRKKGFEFRGIAIKMGMFFVVALRAFFRRMIRMILENERIECYFAPLAFPVER